ncbi:MAG: dNTP triphosphohydrolase [Paludibacteraceae bacterium]|nr:dNTP triphosphohydrolase [Paludibacteraceae bacterium]
MNWQQLITPLRFGLEHYHTHNHDTRNEFQRDFDRLIFSAPFRRLQNKTQVFPLPGSVFVHNRLTHSLEVSCVGRSLGNNVAAALRQKYPEMTVPFDSIGEIVSAACLAHDMGNPPFGHSGEKAIQTYFSEGKGMQFQSVLSPEQWADCTHFEGNANAFRILTHQFCGRRKGGFVLTYSTIASVVKYPYSSLLSPKGKFGYFDSDKQNWELISSTLGIPEGSRFPLVYLVEAADDICYEIMDIEDAHKLRILTTDETKQLLFAFFSDERKARIEENMSLVSDTNEQIAYLRSCVIGCLIDACVATFMRNEENIINGTFNSSLVKSCTDKVRDAYRRCSRLAVDKIYRSPEVLDTELAGYKIIYILMEELMQAVMTPDKEYSRRLLDRIPQQYDVKSTGEYNRILAVLDYISGMTDVYALDLYQKITGMALPKV